MRQVIVDTCRLSQHALSSFYENDGAMGGNAPTLMDEDDSDEDYKPPPQQARVWGCSDQVAANT